VKKNGGVGEYQYGDWLKAVGNRSKPSRNHESESHDELDNATVKEQHQAGVEAATINVLPKNSPVESVTKTVENGSNDKGSPKRQQVIIENLGDKGVIMENIIQVEAKTVDCTNSNVEPDLCPTGLDLGSTQVSGPDGLKPKPKATWERLNWMECGANEFARDVSTPTLGKRRVMCTLFAEHEEHQWKTGRVESGEAIHDEILAGVESHPCREQ